MRLIDIINSPWAVTPEMLREIIAIYSTHLRGEKIDLPRVEAALGRPLQNDADRGYEIRNRTAIIPVDGVLTKRAAWFHAVSGMSSYELITRDFKAALDDSAVEKILFLGDTPGGTVDGIEQATNVVFQARGKKPIDTLCDGQLCSAGYWFGSASDHVYIADGTSAVGSIGVIATHVDVSKAEERYGIKTTEITAGKYKRIASEHAPLSKEGREYIQEKVDYLYSIFVDTVSRNRGVSPDAVLSRMADGKVFIGRQAIDAGLVDDMKTLDEILEPRTAVAIPGFNTHSGGSPEPQAQEEPIMTAADLKAKDPDLYKAVYQEGYRAAEGEMECPEEKQEEARKAGATSERARIKAVHEVGKKMPGHTALIEGLMFDGKTSEAGALKAVVDADYGKRTATAQAIAADAADIAVPAAGAPKQEGKKDFMALVSEYQATAKCSKGAAIRATAKDHPEAHAEWLGKQKTGTV